MRAKYRSLCVRCRWPILPGELIDYAKGIGSAHALCVPGVQILMGTWPAESVVQLSDRSWWVVIGAHEVGMVKARPASPEEIEAWLAGRKD